MVSESRLRAATDLLVQSPDFCGGGDDRIKRIQSAYALAGRIAHVLRDDASEPETFTAQAWDAYAEWCAELEEEVGFRAMGEIPPADLARIFHESATLSEATERVRTYAPR